MDLGGDFSLILPTKVDKAEKSDWLNIINNDI